MSLVGTRPILQDELRQYELHHRARIAIKPGITGMWQVSGRSDITDLLDIFPALISAVIMGVGVYFISYLSLPVIIQFAVQIIFGAIIYVGISYVFKVESFEYILSIVKKKIK